MRLSDETLKALRGIITGDTGRSPYRSGPDLIAFFNQFGYEDAYGRSFPSRNAFAAARLDGLNGTAQMADVLAAVVDPLHYIDGQWDCTGVADYLNEYLEHEGFRLHKAGKNWRVLRYDGDRIHLEHPYTDSQEVTREFITEQIEKCELKIGAGDFDGAITNARSLLEAVLCSIERDFVDDPPAYDGDLPKLYKRVQRCLNLSPGQDDLATPLRQILSGMTSVVSGLAGLRNKMSDSHVLTYRPAEHHARLAVNAAKTLSRFFFETKHYQAGRDEPHN